MGCHFLLQGIFPTQGSKLRLLHGQEDSLPVRHQESCINVICHWIWLQRIEPWEGQDIFLLKDLVKNFLLCCWPLTLRVLNLAPRLVLLPLSSEHCQYKWTQNLIPSNWFALQVRTWTCNLWKASTVWAESHVSFLMELVQKIQEKCLSRTLRFLSQLGRCQDRVNWGCSGLAHSSFIPEMFWFWIKMDGFGQTKSGWIS